MQSGPDTRDAVDYETNLTLLGRLLPAMPVAARTRAAWSVARAKASLAEAVAAEGFDLHGAAAPEGFRTGARTETPTDARGVIAPLRRDLHEITHTVANRSVTDEILHLRHAVGLMEREFSAGRASLEELEAARHAASLKLDIAARALQARDHISYADAVARLTPVTR